MILDVLQSLFTRDLNRLQKEIALYKDEAAIWKVEKQISNSAGNLCLHLIGNLNTYIGKEIGHIDYTRNRELEFSQKGVPKSELLQQVQNTLQIVTTSLGTLDEKSVAEEYPILVFEEKTSTAYLLIHLAMHLSYHLGQINYYRRLIDDGAF